MISLGQNIYLWRLFKGLSQEELAKKAGIPRPNLAVIESGAREPSLATLRLLAGALMTDAGTLLNGVAPVNFSACLLLRRDQEAVAKASLRKYAGHLKPQQKIISSMLAGVIGNKINASRNKFSGNILKARGRYIKNWLMLKAFIEPVVLNKLLAQVDKYSQSRLNG